MASHGTMKVISQGEDFKVRSSLDPQGPEFKVHDLFKDRESPSTSTRKPRETALTCHVPGVF